MTHTFRKKPWIQNTERKWGNTDFVKKKANKLQFMQENNYKIKPPLNTKKIIGHQRLYLDKNSSHSSKALGKKKYMLLLEKRLNTFFLKKKKKEQICN